MNALMSVVALLTLLGILTYGRVQQAIDHSLRVRTLRHWLEARRDLSRNYERHAFQVCALPSSGPRPKPDPGSDSEGVRHAVKPQDVRINLAVALTHRDAEKRRIFQTIVRRLAEEPALEQIFGTLERKLSRSYVARDDEYRGSPSSLFELACFDLEDAELQRVWIATLQRLQDFVDWTELRVSKIDVVHASLPVLKAMFGATTQVEEFYTWREQAIASYNAMRRDPKGEKLAALRERIGGRVGELAAGSDLLARNASNYLTCIPPAHTRSFTVHGRDESGQIHLRAQRRT